jgi:hypothetical protein
MKEERERELELRRVSSADDQHQHQHQQPAPRRATKENKKEKKEKEKEKEKGKSERKRRGSAIKFVGKEKGERERSSRAAGRLDSSGERAPEPIQHAAAAAMVSDEVASLQELVQKGAGTWSKSRGRHEVKIFKHLRSKSSEEVPTAYVAKESREAH